MLPVRLRQEDGTSSFPMDTSIDSELVPPQVEKADPGLEAKEDKDWSRFSPRRRPLLPPLTAAELPIALPCWTEAA